MVKHDFYSYALDNENHLINAAEAEKGPDYFCPSCGEKMILRKGKQRRPHFAHKVNTEHCSYETYLHEIAKKQICKCFNESSEFTIKFSTKTTCAVSECPLRTESPCIWSSLKEFNLKQYYNICKEEVAFDGFRADLLLSPKNTNHPPVIIEIWVTHKSTEAKLHSNYRIIEIQIESEDDIKQIVDKASIIESGYKTRFYNFKGDSHDIPNNAEQAFKHQFWIDNRGWFQFNNYSKCLTPNTPEIANSIFRIESKYQISETLAFQKLTESGLDIKYCPMCRFYRYNDFYERCMCILYKSKETDQFPMLSKAMVCPYYKQLNFFQDSMTNFDQECKITIRKNNPITEN